jgi:hypothetical protein
MYKDRMTDAEKQGRETLTCNMTMHQIELLDAMLELAFKQGEVSALQNEVSRG